VLPDGPRAAQHEADEIERDELRRADRAFEVRPEEEERQPVEDQVGPVRVDEAAGDDGDEIAAAQDVVRPQQVALDDAWRAERDDAHEADDDEQGE
jgi:hypothetical protein